MVFALIAVTLPFVACGGGDGDDSNPVVDTPYYFTAWGKTVTVKNNTGSADISALVNKLDDAMAYLDGMLPASDPTRIRIENVLNRDFVIVVEGGVFYGVGKCVNSNTMSLHIDFLDTSTYKIIGDQIGGDFMDLGFAKIKSSEASRLAAKQSNEPLSNQWLLAAIQRQKGYERN